MRATEPAPVTAVMPPRALDALTDPLQEQAAEFHRHGFVKNTHTICSAACAGPVGSNLRVCAV